MASLLGGVRFEASPETQRGQQMTQIDERSDAETRGADRHPGAGDRIEHPRPHHRDDAGRRLQMRDVPAGPTFAVLQPDRASAERMPPIVDDDLIPDMGRMARC
jgi:hypothetical protein